jgi:hypothetical protein
MAKAGTARLYDQGTKLQKAIREKAISLCVEAMTCLTTDTEIRMDEFLSLVAVYEGKMDAFTARHIVMLVKDLDATASRARRLAQRVRESVK